jgi:hypothetical protein
MRFPGSKLLSQDLSTNTTPLEGVTRQCEDVNFSGYMEIAFGDSEGLILFYLGEQINIIYRAGSEIAVSNEAMFATRRASARVRSPSTSCRSTWRTCCEVSPTARKSLGRSSPRSL